MRTEDGYIIGRCLNGESEAFGFLVDKYKGSIYAFAYAKLQNFHDAEDITQEVFIKAYLRLRTLRRWDNFHAWLCSIATNLCKNWIRARSNRPDGEFAEDHDPEALNKNMGNSYREQLKYESLSESLNEALSSLPEGYRQVLSLYYLGDMNSYEIARFLGTSPSNIRQRLSRARMKLKEEVATMMSMELEAQRLPATFTFRIVEAVKHLKIQPMPRFTGLPWGLSLAAGIIAIILTFNPNLSIAPFIASSTSSPLPTETKILKIGEIPVDIIKTSEISVISNNHGKGDGGISEKSFLLAPQDGIGEWTEKADIPIGRYGMGVAEVDGKIYVAGGFDAPWEILNTLEVYDPANNTWETMATPAQKIFSNAMASVNGKIYIIGGMDGNVTIPTLDEYDPVTDKWSRKASMSKGRSWLTAVVVDGIIYAIGGRETREKLYSEIVEAYDPATDKWTRKADLPVMTTCAASVMDGKIYIMGLRTSKQTIDPSVFEYDPELDIWTQKSDMPTPRVGISVAKVGGHIYAIGGTTTLIPLAKVATVEIYDPKTDTWSNGVDLPEPMSHHVSTVANGEIYVIGGVGAWAGHGISGPPDTTLPDVRAFNFDKENLSVSPQDKLNTTWGEIKSD